MAIATASLAMSLVRIAHRRLSADGLFRKADQPPRVSHLLAIAVLLGLVLNAALGWWWADPAAG
jgi:hypothetical protein